MPGGFATGLAQGIFGELSSQRARKEEQNAQEKAQTLKLLTGLLDQTEPESKPLLIRHIGSVMGLKGPQQGIWARLTGADLESDRGALNESLTNILGSIAPSPVKDQIRQTGTTRIPGTPVDLPLPKFGTERVAAPEQRRSDQIYLRDPYQFELEKLQARYSIQNQALEERMREKSGLDFKRQLALQDDAQKARQELEGYKEENRIEREFQVRAKRYALLRRNPGGAITEKDQRDAIDDLEAERGLKLDNLRAKTNLARSQSVLAEAAAKIDPTTGLPVGKLPTMQQERTFGLQVEKESREKEEKARSVGMRYATARATAKAVGEQLQSAYNKISAQGYSYDGATGKLYNKTSGQEVTPTQMGMLSERLGLKDLTKLAASKSQADSILNTLWEEIKASHQDYYEPGAQMWDVRPKARQATTTGGVPTYDSTTEAYRSQPGATPEGGKNRITGQPPMAAMPKLGASKEGIWPDGYQVGQTIPVGQATMRVDAILGPAGEGKSRYRMTRIK